MQFASFKERIEEWLEKGSSWSLSAINALYAKFTYFRHRFGGSYLPMPEGLEKKRSTLNIKNESDNCCALWCVLRFLHPESIADLNQILFEKYNHLIRTLTDLFDVRPGYYQALSVSDIPTLAKLFDITRNVYEYCSKDLSPLLIVNEENEKHLDLLLYSNEDKTVSHYVIIKNFNGLCRSSKGFGTQLTCKRCICRFYSQDKLAQHIDACKKGNNGRSRIKMPEEGEKCYLKEYSKTLWCPFVAYADIECLLSDVRKTDKEHSRIPKGSFQKHISYSSAYTIIDYTGTTQEKEEALSYLRDQIM